MQIICPPMIIIRNMKKICVWEGSLARDFDLLMQNVEMDTFRLFQRNINPQTGRKLTQRTVTSGVRLFDFQCAGPKSVSIMALFDPRLVDAHDKAVFEAMEELEKMAAVRIRKENNARTNNLEITGKILCGRFRHDTSRSLDPQLHTHNVVVNVTRDSEGRLQGIGKSEDVQADPVCGQGLSQCAGASVPRIGV
ncbi:MAG: relaxase domain-containing protein [Lentisphaeria bacterium]|nr:relaxase domain-containing protein [Lentisphaeria bacterium]